MNSHPHFIWADLFQRGKANPKSMINILKENALFNTLTPKELKYLASLIYERVYQPNEPVFRQNDRGLGMYMIAQGQVAIKSMAPGGDVLITQLGAGSFFGEMALVDPENVRTASAEAMERTVLIGFFISDLNEILERKPAMGVKILLELARVLGKRLSDTTEKITLLTQNTRKPKIHEVAA